MDKVVIIQGDSVEAALRLEGYDVENVEELILECDALKMKYNLKESTDSEIWLLNIPAADTENLKVGCFKYNIVAIFNSGRVKTVLYNADLEIQFKENKWTEVN